jgi:soluble lytic murein transglycosylase-like protein
VLAVQAADPQPLLNPHHEAARIVADEVAIAGALSDVASLDGQHPTSVLDGVRHDLQVDAVAYGYRAAARDEEVRIYDLAQYDDLERAAISQLPRRVADPIGACLNGLHALYQLAGYDAYYLINAHFNKPYGGVLTPAQLKELYIEAQQNYGVDWTYLAAINFVESDFGRTLGPSSAGAEGPMQFLPATWDSYGQGGDINNPRDAIMAAARYLVHYGAPGDMRTAIFHYNLDYNYVDSIIDFSQAMRDDPSWLDRMYYWGTTG